jgi:hypothetical protein
VLLLNEQPESNCKILEIEGRPLGKGADHDPLRSEQLGPARICYGYFMARPYGPLGIRRVHRAMRRDALK